MAGISEEEKEGQEIKKQEKTSTDSGIEFQFLREQFLLLLLLY